MRHLAIGVLVVVCLAQAACGSRSPAPPVQAPPQPPPPAPTPAPPPPVVPWVQQQVPGARLVDGFWCDQNGTTGRCEAIKGGVEREAAIFARNNLPQPTSDWYVTTLFVFMPTDCYYNGRPGFYIPPGAGPKECDFTATPSCSMTGAQPRTASGAF